MGVPLVAGRDFDRRDTPQSPRAAVVSESFARTFFSGRDPLGQSFQVEAPIGDPRPAIQIVGVAKDTKYTDLREPFTPLVHLAATQEARPGPFLQLVVHADTALSAITPAMTRAVADINPSIALQYQSVRTQIQDSLLRERLMATLSGFFGGLAVLIATIGLYGVMSYMVVRRRVEIGVRMALGADRRLVIQMILREAGLLLAVGLVVGAVLSFFAARTAESLLYELKPGDPVTMALAIAILAAVTLLASWVPAARAARLQPTVALREE
jgi:predicted lysophospholipase L1 biosynthesis ABC-type transport system permease subunit